MLGGDSDDSGRSRLTLARAGEESAFLALVERHHGSLSRVAGLWIADPALIETLIEKTWKRMLFRLDAFDSQQSLKGWLCCALIDLVLQAVGPDPAQPPSAAEPAVSADRFRPPGHRWEGHWQQPPQRWPDARADVDNVLQAAVAALPHELKVVLVLRDVERLSAPEVQSALGLSDESQRQLLHQARSRVRAALEHHHDRSPA